MPKTILKETLNSLLNFFFPAQCKICGQPLTSYQEKYVCNRCFSQIEIISCFCQKCGLPLAPSFAEIEDPFCKQCQKKKGIFIYSEGLNLPVVKGNLVKVVNTAFQTSLSLEERLKNVRGAFPLR